MKNRYDSKKPALWITATLAAAAVVPAVILLKKTRKSARQLWDQIFCAQEIVYQAPFYSFSYTSETAPWFRSTKNHELMFSEGADWKSLGVMEAFSPNQDNFDRLFYTGREREFSRIRRRNSSAWRLDVTEDHRAAFYYLLQQKNGRTYLAYGYHTDGRDNFDSQASIIRWLFELAPVSAE